MILLIMCGHFLFVATPTLLPHSQFFIHMSPHSSVVLFSPCKLTTARSLTTSPSAIFLRPTAPFFALTCPYTSQQNGCAERVIRTLNDCVRTLLFHSYVPPRFWPDALATASLLINIWQCRSHWNYTPHQLLFGAVPSYDGLRIFGCLCYPSTASIAPHKLAPRSFLASSLVILPTPKITGAMIQCPTMFLLRGMCTLMSWCSHFSRYYHPQRLPRRGSP